MAWNFGGALESKNASGKWEAHLDCEANQNALKWIQKMKSEDLLLNSTTVYYDDWYSSIGSKVAMAFVGSDVLQLASVNGGVSMGDLAFVPMPTGDGSHHYSLYGGTPYVFSADTSDDQVEGILKFFEYIGRGPDITDISKEAMVEGYKTAAQKNQPILPKIKPWKNEEFLTYANALEKEYISVDMTYYNDFFDHIAENKHSEEPYCTQELYEYLDTAIQNVLQYSDTANVASLLTTANGKLQTLLDENVNQ
jgi:multiple sugar transport system substrate-binding protein